MVFRRSNKVTLVRNFDLQILGVAIVLLMMCIVTIVYQEAHSSEWRANRRQQKNMNENIFLENITMCNYSEVFGSLAYDVNGCFSRVNNAWKQVLDIRRRDADKYGWFNQTSKIPVQNRVLYENILRSWFWVCILFVQIILVTAKLKHSCHAYTATKDTSKYNGLCQGVQ